MVVEPQGALKCRSSTIAVWADSGPFLRVLLSFGGPGVISTIDESWEAFSCRSSTLAFFVDFGLFCGLLLTIFGVRKQFP